MGNRAKACAGEACGGIRGPLLPLLVIVGVEMHVVVTAEETRDGGAGLVVESGQLGESLLLLELGSTKLSLGFSCSSLPGSMGSNLTSKQN